MQSDPGSRTRSRRKDDPPEETVAGNGLLSRRIFLGGAAGSTFLAQAEAQPLTVEPWMKTPGAPLSGYGQPSQYEAKVARLLTPVPDQTTIGTDCISSAITAAFRTSTRTRTDS